MRHDEQTEKLPSNSIKTDWRMRLRDSVIERLRDWESWAFSLQTQGVAGVFHDHCCWNKSYTRRSRKCGEKPIKRQLTTPTTAEDLLLAEATTMLSNIVSSSKSGRQLRFWVRECCFGGLWSFCVILLLQSSASLLLLLSFLLVKSRWQIFNNYT